MAIELPKHYEPGRTQQSVYRRWLDSRAFAAEPDERGPEQRYVIMMPLPNVTGALHMGHAMDNVMQDLLIRWHRMLGDNTLWMPGTDHAGIATQAVVEKRLFELEGKTRHDIGREGLVAKIWEWKDRYQERIIAQLQEMGCSCDWLRQRFTMDPICAAAVREAFFRLFRDGLIFRGDRLVNWDCHLQTAVSDDEIVYETVAGHFWHIRYPVIDPKDGEPQFVTVATTRPETMLGDTAIACHPDPTKELERIIAETRRRLETASKKERRELEAELERLQARRTTHLPLLEKLARMAADGRKVNLPLLDRPIPLVPDHWAKPELGSGCVKVTPGHDPNDYGVWTRKKQLIGIVNILNPDGTLNENAGPYAGLDRFEARDKVLVDLEEQGLIEEIEDRQIEIGHSDRSKTPIEPYLSKQWFIRMGDVEGGIVCGRGTDKEFSSPGLAQAAVDATGDWRSASGRFLTFHPDAERYGGTFRQWLAEKRDWCISRQLWWGHRIPIWSVDLPGPQQRAELVGNLPGGAGRDYRAWISDPEGNLHDPARLDELSKLGQYSLLVCLRSEEAEERLAAELESLGLVRDPDVLDTWFSSALWPMSTLGWPDPESAAVNEGQSALASAGGRPNALDYYYPGSCLVTARDIITLWVARMMMLGLYFRGDVPFTDCFIHANIQDGKGERMSKSKGNGIDPVDIIERYGADAMRYVLCDMQTGTQDIRLPVQAVSPFTGKPVELAGAKHGRSIFTYICPESGKEFDVLGTMPDLPRATLISERFEVGRAFCTKLWNAARFALMNLGERGRFQPVDYQDLEPEDRWILSRLSRAIAEVTRQLEAYNPSAAIGAAREFFWGQLCDWYLELIKPRLRDGASAEVARSVLALAIDQVLRLFHPFVPFISEVLWQHLGALHPERGIGQSLPASELLINAPWPRRREDWEDEDVEVQFDTLREVIRAIRDIRARYDVAPSSQLAACIKASGQERQVLEGLQARALNMAGLSELTIGENVERPRLAAAQVLGRIEIYLTGVLDPVKERHRLDIKKEKILKDLKRTEGKLANENFLARAPADVVEQEKQKALQKRAELDLVQKNLRELD